MANETSSSKLPSEQPETQPVEKPDHFNLDDRRRKLRIGLLVLIALLLGATTAGYAYLYYGDEKVITTLTADIASKPVSKVKLLPSPTPSATAVVRSNPKLAATQNPQVLTIKEWDVSLVLPNETIFSKPSYAILPKDPSGNESAGLANSNLSKYGGTCVASGAPLGMLTRMKAGTFPTGGASVIFVATIAGYDYGFISPLSPCDKAPATASASTTNALHEVIGALNTLEPAK